MIEAITALYVETRTRGKTVSEVSKDFDIGVGVHQKSILNPLLFIVVNNCLFFHFESAQ